MASQNGILWKKKKIYTASICFVVLLLFDALLCFGRVFTYFGVGFLINVTSINDFFVIEYEINKFNR